MSLLQVVSTSVFSKPLLSQIGATIVDMWAKSITPFLQWRERRLNLEYPCSTAEHFTSMFAGKSIAIVWNGPNIDWKWDKIDAHDIVMRMNFWVLPNNLKQLDTWIKTDVIALWATQVIVSSKILELVQQNTALKVLFCVHTSQPPEREISSTDAVNRFFIEQNYFAMWERIWLIPRELSGQLNQELKSPPSTGFSALNFILQHTKFSNISIFGFDFTSNNRIVGNMKNARHNFWLEKELSYELIKWNPRIQIHQ